MIFRGKVISVQSPFQRIDIWEAKDAYDTVSYEEMKKSGLDLNDTRLSTDEFQLPEKYFFLDGTIQVKYFYMVFA